MHTQVLTDTYVDEAETRTQKGVTSDESRRKKQKHPFFFSPENFSSLCTILLLDFPQTFKYLTIYEATFGSFLEIRRMHYLSHPDSPINFVEFIERHGTALDSLLPALIPARTYLC